MRVISVTSGSRGGTGKTTILLNVALLHSYVLYMNENVYSLIIDAEVQEGATTFKISPQLSLLLKREKVGSFIDYLIGDATLREVVKVAILKPDTTTEFPLLITSSMTSPEKFKILERMELERIYERMESFLDELSSMLPLGVVYIDMPATRVHLGYTMALLTVSDIVLPVGIPDPTSLLTLYTTITAVHDYIKPPPSTDVVVVNRVTMENIVEPNTGKRYTDLYRKLLNARYVISIPDDPNFPSCNAASMIEILTSKLRSSRALRMIKKLASLLIESPVEHSRRKVINIDHMRKFLSLGYENSSEAETILLALYRARRRIPLE